MRAFRDDAPEIAFIGSSRIFHQVVPATFSRVLEEKRSEPLRSWNLGLDGMWPPESLYVTRRVLAEKPATLRWIVLEYREIDPKIAEQNETSQRSLHWHDLHHTAVAIEAVWQAAALATQRPRLTTLHARLCARRMIALGGATNTFRPWLEGKRKRSRPKWALEAGYSPAPDEALSAADLPKYRQMVARLAVNPPVIAPSPVLQREVAGLAEQARSAGVELILIITPGVSILENLDAHPAGVPLWKFNDPVAYPALYDPAHRHDLTHLNPAGADLLTRAVAQRFARDVLRLDEPTPDR